MSLAKKLLSDRMADNRANVEKQPVDDSYVFAGYGAGGKAYIKSNRSGEVLSANLSTNGYLKPGQPISVDSGSGLTVTGLPKIRKKQPQPDGTISPTYKIKILYLINNQISGKTEVWLGGDRKEPIKITEFPLTTDIKGLVHNLGKDDKYIVGLQVGGDIHSFHGKDEFKNQLADQDKIKRTRLNNVGYGYFAEFCDPYILPVTVPNNIIGEAMFFSIDKLFPEICTDPNVCTSSSNDNQASGSGSRDLLSASKDYELKSWAFYQGALTQQTPDAIRSQSGTYGIKPFDIIENNRVDQSIALSPLLTRSVMSVLDIDRVERSGGTSAGSQNWSFYIKLSLPNNQPDKYYEFNICSNLSPALAVTREAFKTNAEPKFNSSILILTANDKKIFSHKGEAYDDTAGPDGPNYSLIPYSYEISTPIEVSGSCNTPEDLPNDGPGGLYRAELKQYGVANQSPYIFGYYESPVGTPKIPRDTPPPLGEPYFESYSDRNHLHWRTLVMGNNKQVITMRSEYALSTGPSPTPLIGIENQEKILVDAENTEIVLGGMLPIAISPKDNLMEQLYYFVDDDPYFPKSPNPPSKSSIQKLDMTTYILGVATTKKVQSENIHSIPDNAIVQNCSYNPE
jgi:hypothetical protein